MNEILDIALRALGGVALLAGTMLALLKVFGEKWIESKFERQRSSLKHQQELELQKLRVEIDSTLNANLKLQEREFETLSKAWQLLQIAYIQIAAYLSPLEQWPDIDRLDDRDLEELLGKRPFTPYEKTLIRESPKKLDAFRRVTLSHNSKEVWRAYIEFRDYVLQFGIFFPNSIRNKFRTIEEKFREAIIGKEVGRESNDWNMQGQAFIQLTKDTKQVCDALESEINDQLRERGISQSSVNS